jgi:hypothetical protein
MDGWMDTWIDGWVDGRMDGRKDGWIDDKMITMVCKLTSLSYHIKAHFLVYFCGRNPKYR